MAKTGINYGILLSILTCIAVVLYFVNEYLQSVKQELEVPALVINLDHRTDRIEEIKKEFQGWPTRIERISAVKKSPGWKGCSESHLKCVRVAKERKYPWVLIIEDDCMLTEGGDKRFQRILPYLWANKDRWDIFNGGVHFMSEIKIVDKEMQIFEVRAVANHFYIVNSTAYDKILEGHPVEPDEPIDTYYQKYTTWTMTPAIAAQRPSRSDIENKEEDYTQFIKDTDTILANFVQKNIVPDNFHLNAGKAVRFREDKEVTYSKVL